MKQHNTTLNNKAPRRVFLGMEKTKNDNFFLRKTMHLWKSIIAKPKENRFDHGRKHV